MASVNKVILIGNLGQDPEVRFTGSGQSVATLNLATTDFWVDKSGQKGERTEWHRVVVWGKQAEVCKNYLSKGRSVYVEGRLQTRKWTDKNGNDKYTTEVVAQRIQFLGSKPAGTGAGQSKTTEEFTDTSTPGFPVNGGDELEQQGGGDSDIPF